MTSSRERPESELSSPMKLALRIVDGREADIASEPDDDGPREGLEQIEKLRLAFVDAARRSGCSPASEDGASDSSGTRGGDDPVLFRWGPLLVRERIGRGSSAEVFRAYEPSLDRDVALKLLRNRAQSSGPGPAFSPSTRRRLVEEARLHAKVRHPHVAAVYGSEEHDGRVGMYSELIEGRSLENELHDRGPLGAGEIVSVGLDLCRALAAVHAEGLVHGDVKAANVLRERGGRMVLTDFGAGRYQQQSSGPLLGTPVAVAPEILRGEEPTPASDLYSLGVLLYYASSGRYPVEGEQLEDIVQAHATGERTRLRDRRSDLPARLVEVIERAVMPEPERRFATAGALEEALHRSMHRDQDGLEVRPGRWFVPRAIWAAALLFVVVALGWWVAELVGGTHRSPPTPGSLERISSDRGNQKSPAYSPDGELLAFVSDLGGGGELGGTEQIWVRSASGGEALQVTTGDAPATSPTWSADGEIVFARAGDGLWAVQPFGGVPRRLAERGVDPSVSADGSRLVYEHELRLFWMELARPGAPQIVQSVPQRLLEIGAFEAALSPDGRQVVYFQAESGPRGDLWIAEIDAGAAPRRLTFDVIEAGAPQFSRDGRGVAFWSDRDGTRSLWWVAASGGEPIPLTSGPGTEIEPSFGPADRHLAFAATRDRWRLEVFDPESGETQTLLDRGLSIILPRVSPADGRIAFFHRVGRGAQIFTVNRNGEEMQDVTAGADLVQIRPTWSADGRSILFYRLGEDGGLLRISAEGGPSTLVAAGWDPGTHRDAALDPDGRRLAYLDQGPDDGTTRVLDLETGTEFGLPEPHLHGIRWTPDGEALVGWTHEGTIASCPITGDPCRTLAQGRRPALTADGRLFFHRETQDPLRWELWVMDRQGEEPRLLTEMGPVSPLSPSFDLTPEGQVVWVRHDPGRGEIWRLELSSE